MRLLFVRGNNVGAMLIRAFEGGQSSHVGIVDGEDVIDATLIHGVARRPMSEFLHNRVLVDTIDVPLADEAAALKFAQEQIGMAYDWTGIAGFMFFRDWSSEGAWYCSELCAAALMHGGMPIADRGRRFGVRLLREVAFARS